MSEILDKIPNLLGEFSLNGDEGSEASSRMAVRDPLETAFFALQWNARESGGEGTREREARRRYQEYQHYSRNISILLWFLFDYIEHYKERDEKWRDDFYSRLMLDVEKLLSDTRSLMDAIYQI